MPLNNFPIVCIFLGVTTMLNFFTTSNGFRSTLPVVSNLTAMNVWDGVCMCFIYASLLEFVCVNYVGRKRPLHDVVYRPGENPVTQVSSFSEVANIIFINSFFLSLLNVLFTFSYSKKINMFFFFGQLSVFLECSFSSFTISNSKKISFLLTY